MSQQTILRVQALAAGYRRKVVVDNISFSLETGEILTLIGPNGAGKSTVLKTITAQLPIISGEAKLCNAPLPSLHGKDIARRLSVLLTDRIRTERMTCGDIAETSRYAYTGVLGLLSDADKRIVREAMELVGVGALYDTDFRQISDGQRQCVMLARAIAQEPALLLDEPTSYLDIGHKLHLLSLLRRLSRERHITVIQSLHELELAQKFSDRILCISGGKADRLGTPEEIFSGDYIRGLYGINEGSYDPDFGSCEPPAVTGKPVVFVIGGGGAGIPVYRRLHRLGIPFAASVLHENDLDYPVAAQVITEQAFLPISESALEAAKTIMAACQRVICCTPRFGEINRANEALRDLAAARGCLE